MEELFSEVRSEFSLITARLPRCCEYRRPTVPPNKAVGPGAGCEHFWAAAAALHFPADLDHAERYKRRALSCFLPTEMLPSAWRLPGSNASFMWRFERSWQESVVWGLYNICQYLWLCAGRRRWMMDCSCSLWGGICGHATFLSILLIFVM